MADLDIQKKEGSMWPWILGILAVLVLAGVIWAVTRSDDRDDARMHRDTVPAARDTVINQLDGPVGGAEYVSFATEPLYAAA